MKIRIEIADDLQEDEVIIRCRQIHDHVLNIQKRIAEEYADVPRLTFFKENTEYYFPLEDILFFETDQDCVYAHTRNDAFRIRFRLYELEDILPHFFVRISKSNIVNIRHILAVNRNLTASSQIQFYKSHKQVYVSRLYYKNLKARLDERSYYEESK